MSTFQPETSVLSDLRAMVKSFEFTLFKLEIKVANMRGGNFPQVLVFSNHTTFPRLQVRLEEIRDRMQWLHNEEQEIIARRSSSEAMLAYLCKRR